jgi:hypothetical protein
MFSRFWLWSTSAYRPDARSTRRIDFFVDWFRHSRRNPAVRKYKFTVAAARITTDNLQP